MKQHPSNIWTAFLFTLLTAFGLCNPARADIATGLLSYYTLDEGSGFTAGDAMSYSPSAALNGFAGTEWVVQGRTNGALRFSGTGQYATIDDSTNGLNFAQLANHSFTLATWVRGTPGITQPNGAGLITRGYGGGGEQFLLDVFQNAFRFGVRNSAGAASTLQLTPAATNVLSGVWQHVVAVLDTAATTNHMKLYLNGQLIGQISGPTTLYDLPHEVSLGAREGSSSTGYNLAFNGMMDDVRIYNRALSAADVIELFQAPGAMVPVVYTALPAALALYVGDAFSFSVDADGTAPLSYQWRHDGTGILNATNAAISLANLQVSSAGSYDVVVTNTSGGTTSSVCVVTVANPAVDITSGLVAYFKMDESTGGLASDNTSSTAGATIQNFTTDAQWLPSGGRTNGAYNFAGLTDPLNTLSGQYGIISDTTNALDFSTMATPALSISAWIKTPPGFIEPGGVGLVAKGYGRGGEQYVLDMFGNGPRFFVNDSSGKGYNARADAVGLGAAGAIIVNNGAWTHLVGVLDPTVTPKRVKLFVNGQLAAYTDGPSSLMTSTSDTTIGARQDSNISGYNLPFTGLMDDIRFYNRALTPSDVQALYASVGTAGASIVVGPANTTNFVLSTSTLTATGDGTVPLSYQWQWYGTNLPGATNTSLTFAVSQLSNAGPYAVIITNLYGGITSTPGYLAIVDLATNDYTNALVAEWNFDEASGLSASDTAPISPAFHPSANPLNLVNFPGDSTTWASTARFGSHALRLNAAADDVNGGQNDYGVTAAGLAMPYNYNLYTFAFWVKLDSTTYGSNPRVITPTTAPWALWSSAGGMRIYNGTPGGANPQLNKWTHYVLTYDRGNNRYWCYVNGIKTVNNLAVAAKTAPTAATLWKVGHNEGTGDADYFRGQLDDVRVYNRLLSDSQVAALYASYPPFIQVAAQPQSVSASERDQVSFTVAGDSSSPVTYQWQKNGVDIAGATGATLTIPYVSLADTAATYHAILSNSVGMVQSADATLNVNALPAADFTSSLVARYTFDEDSGDIAHDSSGNGYDASLNNWATGAAKWESGVISNSLHFNAVGTNNFVITPGMTFPNNTADFTFTFWAKCNPTNAFANNPRFFATANIASWVVWERTAAPLGVGFWHGTGGTPAPETNAWHHYAVVFNRTTSRYNVYVDGVRKVINSGGLASPATEADPTGIPWVLGHRENVNPAQDQESFRGWLDDMRIYNRQLTINDAEALYQDANIPPPLSMQVSGGTVTFSWPSWASGYTLKSAGSIAPGAIWSTVPGSHVLTNATLSQSDTVGTGEKFYRMAK